MAASMDKSPRSSPTSNEAKPLKEPGSRRIIVRRKKGSRKSFRRRSAERIQSTDVAEKSIAGKRLIQISTEQAGGTGRLAEDEPYYHGFMSRVECEPLLKSPGDFLVRRAELEGEMQYILSVMAERTNEITNFIIKKTRLKHLYYVNMFAFKTISDLISYHCRTSKPLNADGVYIKKPIFKKDWELAHEQIEKTKKLGEGAFGEVWEGTLNLGVFRGHIPVAIKTLHAGNISADERIKFLREAGLMLNLNHLNIVKFYGVATTKDPIMIVMELATGGSLLSRIQSRENRPSKEDKIRYCAGGACGLAYLEGLQIIHRDVAARNCLLSSEDEVKLSDFGLSLLGIKHREHKMKNVPVRWLAPETLKQGSYSSKSDVWSFGITIWEIYSFGEEPYTHIQDNKNLRKQIINQKVSLAEPIDMQPEIRSILKKCLAHNPDERPAFRQVSESLNALRPDGHQQKTKLSSKFKGLFHL